MNAFSEICRLRVLPAAVVRDAETAVPLAEALLSAGLDLLEITLRTPASQDAFNRVRKAFPKMTLGAGTIFSPEQVSWARQAGADFGVSAGLNAKVVLAARDSALPFIPGVMTPSEVEHALELDCRLLKFFPAESAGGVRALKALAGPYTHAGVRFIPLGGINAANARDYAVLPIVAAIGGSWMVEPSLLAAARWREITALARQALALSAC